MSGDNTAKKQDPTSSTFGYETVIIPIRELIKNGYHDDAVEHITHGLKDRDNQYTEYYIQMAGELGDASEEIIELIWSADNPKDVFISTATTHALTKLIPLDPRVCRRISAGLQSTDIFLIASCCDAAAQLPKGVLNKNLKLEEMVKQADNFIEKLQKKQPSSRVMQPDRTN